MATRKTSGNGSQKDGKGDDNSYFNRMSKGDEKQLKNKEEYVDDTIQNIELDGFKSFFSATTFCGKMFWLLLLAFSLSVLAYQLYKTVSDYLESPTISTFTIKTNESLDFPALYLCPAAIVSRAFLNDTPNGREQAIALKKEMDTIWDYTEFMATGSFNDSFRSEREEDLKKSEYNAELADIDPQQFFLKASVPLEKHLLSCEFRAFHMQPLKCSDIAREVFDPEYGKCYAIDLGNLQQTVEGQGFQFVFNVQSDSYPTDRHLAPIFNGIYMSVVKEFNPSAGDSILLTPNTFTRVDLAIQRQCFMNQPNQGQACVATTDAVNEGSGDDGGDGDDGDPETVKFEMFNANYSQPTCKYDCVARQLAKVCNCVPPTDTSLYMNTTMSSVEGFCRVKHLPCIREKIMADESVTKTIGDCRMKCHVPCKDWRYDVRTTSMDLYKAGFDASQPVKDLIYVAVAYSHMEYSKYTQANSMEPDDLVANLGGQIGLWLGGSMMTLVQIPLFFMVFFGIKCFHKAKGVTAKNKVEPR